jgi:hypothetical protein
MNFKVMHLMAFSCIIILSLCSSQARLEPPCFHKGAGNYSLQEGDILIASWDGIDMNCTLCEKNYFREDACSDFRRVLTVSNKGDKLCRNFELDQSFNNTYVLIRYSRDYYAPILVRVNLDGKQIPGGGYTNDTSNWNDFDVLPPLLLGNLTAGQHNICLSVDKNDWGMEIDVIGVYSGINAPIDKKNNGTITVMGKCLFNPIPNASVSIDGDSIGTTDDNGKIEVQITDGWHNIAVNEKDLAAGCTSSWTFDHNSTSGKHNCCMTCAERNDINDSIPMLNESGKFEEFEGSSVTLCGVHDDEYCKCE